MLSILLFAICRLPTGNVWDAMFDPLLWLWSLFSLIARTAAWLRTARSSPQTA